MAVKIISIDLVAYECLASARSHAKESFSSVIRRAEWPASGTRGSDLLALLTKLPTAFTRVLEALASGQDIDQPPAELQRVSGLTALSYRW